MNNLTKFDLLNKLILISAIVILLQYLFDFSSVDLNVPFSYNGDALLNLVSIKTLLESGWFFYNSQLGMPYGMNFLEFPGSDGFFLIVLKAIGLITHSPAYILNLFYILGFPLIYFSTYWACRQFSINIYLSISIAIVFTIAPFHFFRNLQHIFLATYFIVPLITIVIVDIGFGMPRDSNNFEPTKSVSLKYYLILVLAGMCGVYYAFFSLIFITFSGISGWINTRKIYILKNTFFACLTIIVVVLLNLLPSIIYRIHEGINSSVAQRSFFESDIYGLRITQLLLPIWGHRYGFLADINNRYRENLLITEATSGSLGLIASIGFIALIIIIFSLKTKKYHSLIVLAKLNLVATLFSTIGGFGVLFALLVTPQFRGVNRISIFIAFFSLVAFCILLQKFVNSFSIQKKLISPLYFCIGLFLVTVSIHDQIPIGGRGKHDLANKNFYDEKSYIEKVEKALPKNAMVYQYPYVQFPETPPKYKEGYYDYFRPYIQSQNLRWSNASIKGTDADKLNLAIMNLKSNQQVLAIAKIGFSGVLINRLACEDGCIEFEEQLQKISAGDPIINLDNSNIFYLIENKKIFDSMNIVEFTMGGGFYPLEKNSAGESWNWAQSKGKIIFYNFSNQEENWRLSSKIVVLQSNTLLISSKSGFKKEIKFVPGQEVPISIDLKLLPGVTSFEFDTGMPAINIKPDTRKFGFRVTSVNLTKN